MSNPQSTEVAAASGGTLGGFDIPIRPAHKSESECVRSTGGFHRDATGQMVFRCCCGRQTAVIGYDDVPEPDTRPMTLWLVFLLSALGVAALVAIASWMVVGWQFFVMGLHQ